MADRGDVVRWVTVRGKKVPITAPKGRTPSAPRRRRGSHEMWWSISDRISAKDVAEELKGKKIPSWSHVADTAANFAADLESRNLTEQAQKLADAVERGDLSEAYMLADQMRAWTEHVRAYLASILQQLVEIAYNPPEEAGE